MVRNITHDYPVCLIKRNMALWKTKPLWVLLMTVTAIQTPEMVLDVQVIGCKIQGPFALSVGMLVLSAKASLDYGCW